MASGLSSKDHIGSSPLAHTRWLHDSGKGYVTVAHKPDRKPWVQESYAVEKLYEVVPAYGGLKNVYISQNRFRGSRRTDRIAELSALYSDVDYYKIPDLADMPAMGVLDLALEALEQAKIPLSSLAMFTGQGLALVRRHEPVPGYILPKWERCQQYIFEALSSWEQTRRQKAYRRSSGLREPTTPSPESWSRASSRTSAARDTRTASKDQKHVRKGFDSRTLHKARLDDLRHLLKLRGMDKLPPGQRDNWMYVTGYSMSFLMDPQSLEKELLALDRSHADWNESTTRSRMYAVISRARSAASGETVPWKGQQRDNRYRLTNGEIIQRLQITPKEEAHLQTIVSEYRKQENWRQRDKERKEQKRRSEGVRPRDEYLAEREESRQRNRHLAKKLKGQGKSMRKIGEELGISHTQVGLLLASGD